MELFFCNISLCKMSLILQGVQGPAGEEGERGPTGPPVSEK